LAIAVLAGCLTLNSSAKTQTLAPQTTPTDSATPTPDNAVMITVFLKHDQSRPLSELNAQLEKQGYYKAFPPTGVEVVSWYIVMGIGQVVTLRLPASRLREVNRALENTAWGAACPPCRIRISWASSARCRTAAPSTRSPAASACSPERS
jgi:hypothetical protein